jgi:hypothetical protein
MPAGTFITTAAKSTDNRAAIIDVWLSGSLEMELSVIKSIQTSNASKSGGLEVRAVEYQKRIDQPKGIGGNRRATVKLKIENGLFSLSTLDGVSHFEVPVGEAVTINGSIQRSSGRLGIGGYTEWQIPIASSEQTTDDNFEVTIRCTGRN